MSEDGPRDLWPDYSALFGDPAKRAARAKTTSNAKLAAQGAKRAAKEAKALKRYTRSIEVPPLMTLDRIVRFFWTKKTYDRVFKPAQADLVQEWQQARIAGKIRRARYIKHVLSRSIMFSHITSQLPSSIFDLIKNKLFHIGK